MVCSGSVFSLSPPAGGPGGDFPLDFSSGTFPPWIPPWVSDRASRERNSPPDSQTEPAQGGGNSPLGLTLKAAEEGLPPVCGSI